MPSRELGRLYARVAVDFATQEGKDVVMDGVTCWKGFGGGWMETFNVRIGLEG